jgi:FG-GAP repeat
MRRTAALLTATLAMLLTSAAPGLGAGQSAALIDFDDDSFEDLAVGAPGENTSAGAVNVLYGSSAGLVGANQTLTQANSEAGDRFGTALAKGDFDGDGVTDLAVGASGEGVSGAESAGVVSVHYGTEDGLSGAAGQVLFQGNPERFDLFGDAVAAGRFNNDAFDDLAVGAPGETVGGDPFAGAVTVFFGSAGGLDPAGQALFQGNPEPGDQFGGALVAALLEADMDTISDLAVGAPGETVGGAQFAGAVDLFFADNFTPLPSLPTVELYQGHPEAGDAFGSALAAGNFGYLNGAPEIAVGAPGETVGGREGAGAVELLTSRTVFTQGSRAGGAGGNPEAQDLFGFALASRTNPNDGLADLVIGAPGEDIGALTDTGVVHTLLGGAAGLFLGPLVSQDTPNVAGQAEAGDAFGAALATGRFSDPSGVTLEVAVGAPGEGVGTAREAGAVTILKGLVEGAPPAGSQQFTQGRVAGGQPEVLDNFGAALA